jgi:hypothetical protein
VLQMPKSKLTDKKIKEKIVHGHGQGNEEDYKAWINVRSFPSRGLSSRTPSPINWLVHQSFSKLESDFLRVAYLVLQVKQIKDQIALLPLEETMEIAKRLKIRHPTVPGTTQPVVMTTDFLIETEAIKGRIKKYARSIKYAKELSLKRVIEKLEIEYYYWRARNIDWGLVTEKDLHPDMIYNARLLYPCLRIDDFSINQKNLQSAKLIIKNRILQMDATLQKITEETDTKFGFPRGTGIVIAYHLIATKILKVNLYQKIDAEKILTVST